MTSDEMDALTNASIGISLLITLTKFKLISLETDDERIPFATWAWRDTKTESILNNDKSVSSTRVNVGSHGESVELFEGATDER